MKDLVKSMLPKALRDGLKAQGQIRKWKARDFLENAPQFVKQKIFLRYGVPGAAWVETGTFKGTTTAFLAEHAPHVHSIEPAKALYDAAVQRFAGQNVTLYNDVSEAVLPDLLPRLTGDLNFWLDGHYSAGVTFKGDKECPVEDELTAFAANAANFANVTILIDDVRCFLGESTEYSDYPSIDYLVDWARANGFRWRIEHDIFVMQKRV